MGYVVAAFFFAVSFWFYRHLLFLDRKKIMYCRLSVFVSKNKGIYRKVLNKQQLELLFRIRNDIIYHQMFTAVPFLPMRGSPLESFVGGAEIDIRVVDALIPWDKYPIKQLNQDPDLMHEFVQMAEYIAYEHLILHFEYPPNPVATPSTVTP